MVCVRTRNNALGDAARTPASRLRDAPRVSHWLCCLRLDNIREKETCSRMNDPRQVMLTMSSFGNSESVNHKYPNIIETFVRLYHPREVPFHSKSTWTHPAYSNHHLTPSRQVFLCSFSAFASLSPF